MAVRKNSPLLLGLLLLALITPLGVSSLGQQALPAAAAQRAAAPFAPVTTPTVTLEGDSVGAALGSSVDDAGDVNGDGFEDLIAGAPMADVLSGEATLADAGEALIYYGSATGLSATADLTLAGATEGEHFGHAVAGVGDVNGDGFDDVAVSALLADGPDGADQGRVDVFLGSAAGLVATASFSVVGQPGSEFGMSLDGGDVNGDSFADLIVGAPLWDDGETDEGVAVVYYGSAAGITTAGALTLQMNQVGAHFGHSVAFAGDTDGEGFGDVLVGAPMYANGETDEGAAFLFDGAATGLTATASWTYECNIAGAMCGEAVAGNGNLNGDAFADVMVGAPGVGQVFAFLGSATGLPTAANSTVTGPAGAEFGSAVAFAGDTNGDGLDDALVGAPASDAGGADSGYAALFYGTAAGLQGAPPWSQNGAAGDAYGSAVAGGDFDGDGFSDLGIGAPGHDPVEVTDAGAVFVYAGAPDDATQTPTATATSACLGTPTQQAPDEDPPTAGLLERQVGNCYDDAHERTDTDVVFALLDSVTTGVGADGARYSGGFLFRNVDIPQGSVVVSATLQLYALYQSGVPLPLVISGDNNTESAQDFWGSLSDISDRVRTSSTVSFTLASRAYGWVNSPDVTGLAQELLDRDSWRAGYDMAFLIDPAPGATTYATWAAYERSPELAARLLIRYQPPPTATPTVTHTPTATLTPTATTPPTATRPTYRLYLPLISKGTGF